MTPTQTPRETPVLDQDERAPLREPAAWRGRAVEAPVHPALLLAALVGVGAVVALALGVAFSPQRRAARREAEVAETAGRWEAAARAAPAYDDDGF